MTQLPGKRNEQQQAREDIRLFEKAEKEKVKCSVGSQSSASEQGPGGPGRAQRDLEFWVISSQCPGHTAHLLCVVHTVSLKVFAHGLAQSSALGATPLWGWGLFQPSRLLSPRVQYVTDQ